MTQIGHRRASICTYVGEEFFPLAPDPERIWLLDVAHHLSNACRYAGACPDFFSVSQHSVLVSRCAEQLAELKPYEHRVMVAKWGLLHDAAEAYLTDVPSPIKSSLVGFQEIEQRLLAVVAQRFGLPVEMPPEVLEADSRVFESELEHGVMQRRGWWQPSGRPSSGFSPLPALSPTVARGQFLLRARELFSPEEYESTFAPADRG